MCDSNVGVAKALDLEKISKEIADLVKGIDDEVSVEVSDIKRIQKELEDVIKKGKP
jgi:hypothetical protein